MGITQVTKYRTPPEYSEGDAASYDNIYFQTDLWYWWLIEAYPQNQAKRVKFALVGIRTICIRWRKNNVTREIWVGCLGNKLCTLPSWWPSLFLSFLSPFYFHYYNHLTRVKSASSSGVPPPDFGHTR